MVSYDSFLVVDFRNVYCIGKGHLFFLGFLLVEFENVGGGMWISRREEWERRVLR
jgi:hypothetical protein